MARACSSKARSGWAAKSPDSEDLSSLFLGWGVVVGTLLLLFVYGVIIFSVVLDVLEKKPDLLGSASDFSPGGGLSLIQGSGGSGGFREFSVENTPGLLLSMGGRGGGGFGHSVLS